MTSLPPWVPAPLIDSVGFRLARADELIHSIALHCANWSHDPLTIVQYEQADGSIEARVDAIKPVPPVVQVQFSEAVHHLRSALENALFFMVERASAPPLSEREERLVALPITETPEQFATWHGKRKSIPPIVPGGVLFNRIEALQPFNSAERVDSVPHALAAYFTNQSAREHPLSLLQQYSNTDKHRAIRAVALQGFTRDDSASGAMTEQFALAPVAIGDTLVTILPGEQKPMSTWSVVGVHRPVSGDWVVPAGELAHVARYVRDIALPVLLTATERPGEIPPSADLRNANGLPLTDVFVTGVDGMTRAQAVLDGQSFPPPSVPRTVRYSPTETSPGSSA